MRNKVLIIFTEGHPDIDTGFIAPELKVTHNNFDRVIVYPLRWENKPTIHSLPVEVILKSDLANYLGTISSFNKKFNGLFSNLFWRSITEIKPSKIKSLLNTCGYVSLISKWISKIQFDQESTIFYTYWLTAPTLALVYMKERRKITYLISRAHGFDLYNERGNYIQNFFKPYIFSRINRIYCISEYGRHYLALNYSKYANKFTVSRLGTLNDKGISIGNPEVFEIVSCSLLTPVKRVELIIEALCCLQKKHQAITLMWTHIGSGPLAGSLLELAGQKLNTGSFNFTGSLSTPELFELYHKKYFNCFINVSESEGIPVSIMEAQSFGIPVLATDVGGTSEIVNNYNGLLLPSNPTPTEISEAIYNVIGNSEIWKEKRTISRQTWEEFFMAEANYREFGEEISSLITIKQE